MVTGATLRVDVLGTPVVELDGAPVVVDTRKAVALLGVLAVSLSAGRGAVSRAELAALLWSDSDETRARGSLRRTLSVLIAATGDTVHADREAVRLRGDAVASDVVTFRALAVEDDRVALARAVGLVRGELLAGFALREAATFDDWVAREADALRRELGAVHERLLRARLRHGELHPALADATRWLELDPLHEAARRSVMRLLAWTGRRQDALEEYHRCVRVLGSELGVAPVRATTDLYDAIRAGTLAPPRSTGSAPARVAAAGAAPVPLVGRGDALRRLRAAMGRGGRLVILTGEAGAGRSRMVDELADEGVLVARARGGSALSFAPVPDVLRAAIALGGRLPDDLAAEVARLVPEALPPGRPAPGPLSTPGARDLFFDAVLRVLSASGARAVVVEDVHAVGSSGADVLAYLIHRLDRLPCPLVLTWREPGLPERHPVQVALARGRWADHTTRISLPRLTREQVATVAGDRTDQVWRDSAGLPMLVAAAVRAGGDGFPASAIDLMASRLAEVSEETEQVVGALAVLDGVADPALLHATSGRAEAEVVDAVEEALGAGLVREEGGAIAFTHDMLRRVAYDRLSLVRRRLLHHRAARTLAGRRDAEERPGAVARHFHLGGRDDDAATWAWRAAVRTRELYAHEETLHELDVVASLGRDDEEVARARGEALVALARYEPARDAFARALAMATTDGTRAAIERRLADIAARQGEWERAAAGLQMALSFAGDDHALRARLLADRAVVAVRAGDPGLAAEAVAAATSAALVAGPQRDAYVDNVAGIAALAAGHPGDAIDRFGAALVSGPDEALAAAIHNNLANAYAAAGRADEAVATARVALELGRRVGDRHRLAALHANLVDRLHETGDDATAIEHLKESAALFAEVGADPLDRPDVWTLTAW